MTLTKLLDRALWIASIAVLSFCIFALASREPAIIASTGQVEPLVTVRDTQITVHRPAQSICLPDGTGSTCFSMATLAQRLDLLPQEPDISACLTGERPCHPGELARFYDYRALYPWPDHAARLMEMRRLLAHP